MPAIHTERRVQIEGGRIPILVERETLQVDSCEQFSLTVKGVPPAPPAKPAAGKKAAKKKPTTRRMEATYRPSLSNVKFAAIYDGGQASGLKVKVGKGKFVPLTQPIVYTDRAASALGSTATIVLQNETATPRTAFLIVGSNLPATARESQLIDGSRRKEEPSPKTRKGKGKTASKKKKSARKKK